MKLWCESYLFIELLSLKILGILRVYDVRLCGISWPDIVSGSNPFLPNIETLLPDIVRWPAAISRPEASEARSQMFMTQMTQITQQNKIKTQYTLWNHCVNGVTIVEQEQNNCINWRSKSWTRTKVCLLCNTVLWYQQPYHIHKTGDSCLRNIHFFFLATKSFATAVFLFPFAISFPPLHLLHLG